jgi:hypothetical protein
MQPVSTQQIGKYAYNNRDIVWIVVFYSVRAQWLKRRVQLRIGNWVPEFVESGALKVRLRRWRYEFRCGVLTSGQRRDNGSWRIFIVKIRYQETSGENIADE